MPIALLFYLYFEGEFIMVTIIVYWNAKSFTKYKTVKVGEYGITKNYIWIKQEDPDGKVYTLYIPWHTINRFITYS